MKTNDSSMRRRVFLSAVALAAVMTLAFGIDALREQLIVLGVVDFSVSVISLGIVWAAYRKSHSAVPNWIFVGLMTSFFVYLFATGGHGGTGLLFMLLIPVASPLFLGWKHGAAVSLVSLLICAGLAVWANTSSFLPGIPESTLLSRVAAIYVVSLIMSGSYDFGMDRAYLEETRAREALRQSEERYRTILEETGDGYFEADLAGDFTFVNDAQVRLLGYSREQIIGTNFRAFTPEEKVEAVFKGYKRLYETGEPLRDFTDEVIRGDGSHGLAETSAFPIRNDKGVIIGFRGIRRDITERKKAEEALRESEERYRTLFERTTSPILVINTRGNYIDGNEAALRFLECTREELMTKNVRDYSLPGSDEQLLQEHKRLWVEGGRIDTEHYVNGTLKILDLTITPGMWHGQVVVFGVGTDITERRQAEEAVRIQKAYFQQLFDGSPDAIVMLDTDEQVVQANRGFETLFGYIGEEITGRRINELVIPGDGARESSTLSRTVLHGRVVRKDVVRRRKDGRPVDVSVVGYPIRLDDKTVGIYVIYTDISKRKKAEDALRQSEERYRTILEEMEDSYFEVDLGGHLTFVNDSVCRDLGHSREELAGMSYKQFIAEEDVESVFRVFNEVYLTGIPNKGFPWKTIREDGSYGFAETSVSPLRNDEGEIIGFRGVGRDITERRKMQEQLMLTDRLASIGQLTSGIAHELNNPLTGVIGFSDLLLRRDLPADVKEDLETVNREARRTSTVVKGLLAFARQQGTEKAPVDVNNIIEEVLPLRSYEQRVNNIEVDARFAAGLPQVLGNGAQLQQVFINIIINAEQAMLEARAGGRLTIATESVGDVVRVSVADDGPGISPGDMQRLFTPFFTTKEVGKGTGLGLSICHGIVTEHGGSIYAESEPGEGATFVVELPISRQSDGGGV